MEDKILDNLQEIAEMWANHFEKLQKYEDGHSDDEYQVERLAERRSYDGILSSPISASDMKKFESLPNGKAISLVIYLKLPFTMVSTYLKTVLSDSVLTWQYHNNAQCKVLQESPNTLCTFKSINNS